MENQIKQLAIEFARQSGFEDLAGNIERGYIYPGHENAGIRTVLKPVSDDELLKRLRTVTIDEQMRLIEKYPYKQHLIPVIVSDERYSMEDRKKWAVFISMQLAQVIGILESLNVTGDAEIRQLVSGYREIMACQHL